MNTTHRKQLRRDVPVLSLILIAYFICAQAAYGQIPIVSKDMVKHRAPLSGNKAFPSWPCTLGGYPSLAYGEERIVLTSQDFGKTWASSGSLCVSDFSTFRFVLATRYAHAQGKPPVAEIKPPATYVLNAESSQRFIDLENQKIALRRQYADVVEKQDALLMGANVPAEERKTITNWQPGTAAPWEAKDGVLTFKAQSALRPTP